MSVMAQGNTCKDLLRNASSPVFIRTIFNQDNRQNLIKEYAEKSFRTPEENGRWIKAVDEKEKASTLNSQCQSLRI